MVDTYWLEDLYLMMLEPATERPLVVNATLQPEMQLCLILINEHKSENSLSIYTKFMNINPFPKGELRVWTLSTNRWAVGFLLSTNSKWNDWPRHSVSPANDIWQLQIFVSLWHLDS